MVQGSAFRVLITTCKLKLEHLTLSRVARLVAAKSK
jgi:hypothetical protein